MRKAAILKSFRILALIALMSPALAFAADPAMPEPLKALAKQGAEFRYLGNDGGLNGWVTFKNGHEQYFYVTPDQQNIILGMLYNNKGDLITIRQVEALRKSDPSVDKMVNAPSTEQVTPVTAPPTPAAVSDAKTPDVKAKSGPSKAQELYADMEAASWIALGQKTAPAIYTIIDPQCPHCHDMIQDIRKSGLLEKGQLQVRLIPVGLMSEDSLKQAANLLQDPDPTALYRHLDGDNTALMKDPNPNTQSVQRNMVLMQTWKLDVTPFTIYKSKSGEIKILRGRPNDLKSLVADLK